MTIFNTSRNSYPLISFLIMEELGILLRESPSIETKQAILQTYKTLLNTVLSDEECLCVVERLQNKGKEADEEQPEEGSETADKSMGSSYMKWVQELSPEKLCMFLAGYDFEKAKYLYSAVDYEAIIMMGELKQQHEWNTLMAKFETTMYGFGGSYKGDSASGVDGDPVIDTTPNEDGEISQAAHAAIKSMGF